LLSSSSACSFCFSIESVAFEDKELRDRPSTIVWLLPARAGVSL
jgi:hypothetical protein